MGGPQAKKSAFPSVCVIDLLQEKMYDKFDKEGGGDADRGRGEDGENQDGPVAADLPAEIDPMLMLDADVDDEPSFETPQKRKRNECVYKRKSEMTIPKRLTDQVKAINMPKRPICAGRECQEIQIVYLYLRPNSKKMAPT